MNRKIKLHILKKYYWQKREEFLEWGATDLALAEELDELLTQIREMEASFSLEKEIVESIKQINKGNRK
tara:strand:+ start:1115 stop:1321 length:207 start_codon:yes stop_codon:yes gene_type:complete